MIIWKQWFTSVSDTGMEAEVGVAQNSLQVLQVAQIAQAAQMRNLRCALCLFSALAQFALRSIPVFSALAQFAFANR